jgi:hypothetical protein
MSYSIWFAKCGAQNEGRRHRRSRPLDFRQLKTQFPAMAEHGYGEIAERIDQQAIVDQIHPARPGNPRKSNQRHGKLVSNIQFLRVKAIK